MPRTIALCYVRKSLVRRGQTDPASPAMQEAACLERAKSLHLQPEIYSDSQGHSSGQTEARPAWQRLRKRLNDPDIAALIVYAQARAVRKTKLFLQLIDDCTRLGVRFVSISQNIDTQSSDGRLILTMLAAVDESEASRASERRIETIDFLRRHKGRHYGTAPFGTERARRGGDLVLVPSTKPQPNGSDHQALTRCYEIYVYDGLSYERTAAQLNAEGWRIRSAKGPRAGELRLWTISDVRERVETHWTYAGYVTVGRAYRDLQEILKGNFDPILPDALTAAVAAKKETFRKLGSPAHIPQIHVLTGLLHCPSGCVLRGANVKGVRLYRHETPCPGSIARRYDAEMVESQVRQRIAGLTPPANLAAEIIAQVNRNLAVEQGGGVASERARIAASLERLKELYVEGDVSKDEYAARKAALLAEMPQDGPAVPLELTGFAVAQQAVLTAPAAAFRSLVRVLYVSITVTPDGLEFVPREWCADWA